jgi:hypothetical protein
MGAYICKNENGERSACNVMVPVDKSVKMSLSEMCIKEYIEPYLEFKDGEKLKGTDFYHLFNYLKSGIECPRVELALSYSKNWDKDRLKKEGLIKYLLDITT